MNINLSKSIRYLIFNTKKISFVDAIVLSFLVQNSDSKNECKLSNNEISRLIFLKSESQKIQNSLSNLENLGLIIRQGGLRNRIISVDYSKYSSLFDDHMINVSFKEDLTIGDKSIQDCIKYLPVINKRIPKKNDLIEFWLDDNNTREHKRDSLSYKKASKYIKEMMNGGFFSKCKIINSSFLSKFKVSKKYFKKDYKFDEETIKLGFERLKKLHKDNCFICLDCNYYPNKDTFPKDLHSQIYNNTTGTSWFLVVLHNDPIEYNADEIKNIYTLEINIKKENLLHFDDLMMKYSSYDKNLVEYENQLERLVFSIQEYTKRWERINNIYPKLSNGTFLIPGFGYSFDERNLTKGYCNYISNYIEEKWKDIKTEKNLTFNLVQIGGFFWKRYIAKIRRKVNEEFCQSRLLKWNI